MTDVTEKISLRVDPDTLTIGDLEDFEEGVGKSLDEAIAPVPVLDPLTGDKVLDEKGRPEMTVKLSMKALAHLVWIVQRADNPAFTIADARKTRIASLEIVDDSADAEKDDSGNDDGGESDTPA